MVIAARLFRAKMNRPNFCTSTFVLLIATVFHFHVLPTFIVLADDELDFYSFTVMDIHDNIVSLGEYRGKVSSIPHTHERQKDSTVIEGFDRWC